MGQDITRSATVVIKTAGDRQVGMGHVYRCLGLAQELEKQFRVVLDVNGDPGVAGLLKSEGVAFRADCSTADLLQTENASLLVYDRPSDDSGLFRTIKASASPVTILALDYFNYDTEDVDVIVNLFNHNVKARRPTSKRIRYYVGLKYAIIREEFQHHCRSVRRIAKTISRVLVTFGGADPGNNTQKAMEILGHIGMRDIHVDVVLGPLCEVSAAFGGAGDVSVWHSVAPADIVRFMVEADIAFCGAGTTMLELLSVGTPAVVIPQNEAEERFAAGIAERGAIGLVNRWTAEPSCADAIWSLFASGEAREAMSRMGQTVIDGRGTDRICRIIAARIERAKR